jgi:hypothetical protein
VRKLDARGKDLVAFDLMIGRLHLNCPTEQQARMLSGCSFGYLNALRHLDEQGLAEIRLGQTTIAALVRQPRRFSESRFEKVLRAFGLERAWKVFERLTRPTTIAAE